MRLRVIKAAAAAAVEAARWMTANVMPCILATLGLFRRKTGREQPTDRVLQQLNITLFRKIGFI